MHRRENYHLRRMEEKDLEMVLKWRNSDHVRANSLNNQIITLDEHRSWFEKVKHSSDAICMIFECNRKILGVVNLTNIDKKNNKCKWGFYLGEEDLPKGTGTVMGYLGLEFAFDEIGFRKITGEVLAFNTRSIQFHEKLGFVEEARLIRHILINNNYEDIVIFSLFDQDWQDNKPRLFNIIFS
jgi:UDP-4-amino-4,6-dideoxy-N-acetyl-beta-L-altrosamine N-acetyltransferase